ncbi:MAG: hypothetical protein ABFS41_01570 [Myxococcota bacterium]
MRSSFGKHGKGLMLGLLACLALGAPAHAVILDGQNECSVKLKDGTDVMLIGEFQSRIGTRSADAGPVIPLEDFRGRPAAQVSTRGAVGDAASAAYDAAGGAQGLATAALRGQYGAPDFREHRKSNRFYYLPPGNSLHLSKRSNGVPEFLFVKYTSDEAGGAQGGLMHFLMEWSLTTKQMEELEDKVKTECRVDGQQGELVGAVPLDEGSPQGSFRIISGVLSDEGMTRSLVQSGHAPTMPGGKVAAAANLSKDGAALFLATVEKSRSIADLSVELDYSYVIQLPAAKGEIVFHWDRMEENRESYTKTVDTQYGKDETCNWWQNTFGTCGDVATSYSETEIENVFNTLVENSVVEFLFEGYNPESEYTGKVMEAMLQYFTNSMMQPVTDPALSQPQDDDEDAAGDDEDSDDQPRSYSINREKFESAFAVKKQVIRMDAGLAVRRPIQVVGNMASWYNSVKDNKACVQEVNLSDPFFQLRDIRFILDLDAKEIFDDVVNYVTVNVKKNRTSGTPFSKSLTIDAAYLKDKGIAAATTYARESDKNSEVYQYQTQWSLKGGKVWPPNPNWQQGKWEGVTLAPPVERWFVEVEGDLDEMKANDIARVSVEMHYPLLGEEAYKVVALSPGKGEYLVGEHIYVDKGTRGFAYRLIVHHKKEGRMALPWSAQIGERYLYANLPPELLAAESPVQQAAKEAGKQLGAPGKDKVLNQFEELFASGS